PLPLSFFFLSLHVPPPPTSTLFPYTTLFRSRQILPIFKFGEEMRLAMADPTDQKTVDEVAARTGLQVNRALALASNINELLDHRSEEHTSELQSLAYLVCRLLLEKKKKKIKN